MNYGILAVQVIFARKLKLKHGLSSLLVNGVRNNLPNQTLFVHWSLRRRMQRNLPPYSILIDWMRIKLLSNGTKNRELIWGVLLRLFWFSNLQDVVFVVTILRVFRLGCLPFYPFVHETYTIKVAVLTTKSYLQLILYISYFKSLLVTATKLDFPSLN